MNDPIKGVVLVGHGGLPKDCPEDLVAGLKRLEGQRRAAKQPLLRKNWNSITQSVTGHVPR